MPMPVGIIADEYTKPSGGAFTPASLTSLAAWYDATDAATFTFTTGNQFSMLNDKSPNAYHLTATNHPNLRRDPNMINGLPAIINDHGGGITGCTRTGVNINTLVGSGTDCMMFILMQTNNLQPMGIFGMINGTWRVQMDMRNPPSYWDAVDTSGGRLSGNLGQVTATNYLLSMYRNGVNQQVRINGTPVLSKSTASGTAGSETGTLRFMDAATNYLGRYGEVIHVARYNATDLAATEAYLISKWGLTVQSPTELSGLQAWYDAWDASSFTYSSGTVVSQWNDKSGFNRHLTQATTSKQPNRNGTRNGKATVTFDGVDDFIKSASFTQAMPYSVVVALDDTGPAFGSIFSEGGGWVALTGPSYVTQRDGSTNTSGSNWTRGGVHTYIADFAAAAGLVSRDGNYADPYGNALPGAGITTGFSLNENGGGFGAYSKMGIFEVCLYNRILNTTEKNWITNYMRNKWATP